MICAPDPCMSFIDPAHHALELTMIGASARQRALQSNLANINTPGYQRVDVDFHAELRNAMNAQAAGRPAAPNFAAAADTTTPVRPDGNAVDVDQEAAMIAETALEYQAAAQLLGLRRRTLEATMRMNS